MPCSLLPKYFSEHFLRTKTFSHNDHSIMIKFRKYIVLSNQYRSTVLALSHQYRSISSVVHVLILPTVPIMWVPLVFNENNSSQS